MDDILLIVFCYTGLGIIQKRMKKYQIRYLLQDYLFGRWLLLELKKQMLDNSKESS